MYLSDFCRFLLCTCGWERRGERGAGEGEGARERGIECILYGYSWCVNCTHTGSDPYS
jgi:hypothetical protein